MLTFDPYKRISISEALKHPWFKSNKIKVQPSLELISTFYKNIVSFKTSPKYFFQHATLAYMIHHILKMEDTEDIRKLFIYLDTKGDGKLTYNEITNGFKKCYQYNEKDLLKVIKFIDYSKNGTIEFEEFVRACCDKNALLTNENIETIFVLFTKDPTQKHVSPSLFKSILGLQSKFTDKTWQMIIETVDINKDNQIDLDEFKEMMLKFINDDKIDEK